MCLMKCLTSASRLSSSRALTVGTMDRGFTAATNSSSSGNDECSLYGTPYTRVSGRYSDCGDDEDEEDEDEEDEDDEDEEDEEEAESSASALIALSSSSSCGGGCGCCSGGGCCGSAGCVPTAGSTQGLV